MKKAADLSAAEVAPTSGTGGICAGMGRDSITPETSGGYIDSR